MSCTVSKLLRPHGTGSERSARATLHEQLLERIKARWRGDIGRSLHAALVSEIMQEDQVAASLSVTPSTKGLLVHARYGALFFSSQRIRQNYFRHHLCAMATGRSTKKRSVKRRQHGFGRL
jgi:hypothetical protein